MANTGISYSALQHLSQRGTNFCSGKRFLTQFPNLWPQERAFLAGDFHLPFFTCLDIPQQSLHDTHQISASRSGTRASNVDGLYNSSMKLASMEVV